MIYVFTSTRTSNGSLLQSQIRVSFHQQRELFSLAVFQRQFRQKTLLATCEDCLDTKIWRCGRTSIGSRLHRMAKFSSHSCLKLCAWNVNLALHLWWFQGY